MPASLFEMLGLRRARTAAEAAEEAGTDTVRRIVRELELLDEGTAKFLAGFAYVLSRVAAADRNICHQETAQMVAILRERGHLTDAQATLVVEIAKAQHTLFGATENFLVTREFKAHATDAQRRDLLDCLFAVSAADDSISVVEEEHVRRIATELGLTHQQYVTARARYSKQREVMKGFHQKAAPAAGDG
jgi:uncharacterized tellurite resistance protein B-like protein